jgi:nicotinate phosphoribosyltransferase
LKNPIITHLTDTDLYKFTTSAFAFANYPTAIAEFTFKCRNKDVNLRPYAREIDDQIAALGDLSLTVEERNYLEKQGIFSQAYLNALERFRFQTKDGWSLGYAVTDGEEGLEIIVRGPWWEATLYEIFILAIVNEVYMTDPKRNCCDGACARDAGWERLLDKMRYLKAFAPKDFTWTEFGTRRRFSREWQETVLDSHLNHSAIRVEHHLAGTSNVYLAMKYGIPCVGTMPHEYLQAFQALSPLYRFQKDALDAWIQFWRGNLGVALTDVVGMDAFERDFDYLLAKSYDGVRHDSGDPFEWGNRVFSLFRRYGIQPTTKKAIWSDGLDFEKALALHQKFSPFLQCGFGIGTSVTNDVGLTPLNIVMKLTSLNGQPVAKLSDAPGKTMCNDTTYLAELRRAQGIKEN